jgi:cytochrome c
MMTIKKSFNLLPAILIVASSVTIVACSKTETPSQQGAESSLSQTTEEMATDVERTAEETAQSADAAIERADTAAMEAASDVPAEMLDLAKKSGCLACHTVDKKLVGPSFREVAAKYRGQSDAKTVLITSISKGSTGKWGTMAMTPNSPKVSDADIAKLADFVLSLK